MSERIDRLPAPLRPAAGVLRDAVVSTMNWYLGQAHNRRIEREWSRYRQDVYEKLRLGVRYIHECGVTGDVAEFGVMGGMTAEIIARELALLPERRLHLFDSFEGLPESHSNVDRESPSVVSGLWARGTCSWYGVSPESITRRCSKLSRERIGIYKGWFTDTMPRIPSGTTFAMVHIDCDLYQSAKDVLSFLFSRRMVSEGAIIFFDDWNCNRASQKFGERRAWAETVERFIIVASDGGDYGTACHKFIVHSYDVI